MRRLFVDSSVLLYAVGESHDKRDDCRRIIELADTGQVELHGSVEVIQEVLFHRLSKAERSFAVAQSRAFRRLVHCHEFDLDVLDRMLDLVEHTRLRGRDAVHAATALEHGFTEIVTADSDFDDVPGLTRIDPAEALS